MSCWAWEGLGEKPHYPAPLLLGPHHARTVQALVASLYTVIGE